MYPDVARCVVAPLAWTQGTSGFGADPPLSKHTQVSTTRDTKFVKWVS